MPSGLVSEAVRKRRPWPPHSKRLPWKRPAASRRCLRGAWSVVIRPSRLASLTPPSIGNMAPVVFPERGEDTGHRTKAMIYDLKTSTRCAGQNL